MLKTNSKKAKENVRNYIFTSCIDYLQERATYEEKETGVSIPLETAADRNAFIRQIFNEEYAENVRFYKTYQETFHQWLSGLSCGGLSNYFLSAAVETAGNILEQTPAERARYTESDAERLMSALLYREIFQQ